MPGRVHDILFEIAFDQYGFVTADDALAAGIHRQRLVDMERRGTLERVARGVYRFKSIPHTGREALMEAVLWPRRVRGVLSHDTALELHELCDINPSRIHVTVPRRYRINREIPVSYRVHYRDLSREDQAFVEGLPVVTPRRAILDAIESNLDPKLMEQSLDRARRRGLIPAKTLTDLEAKAKGLATP